MRRAITAFLSLIAANPAFGHDVWMQTDRYVVPVGAAVPYRIFVGHGTFREPWDVGIDRIVSMKSIGTTSSVDLKPTASSNGAIRFDKPGSYVVAMVSTNAKSDLPALRFNDYAKAEGLTVALAAARSAAANRSKRTRNLQSPNQDAGQGRQRENAAAAAASAGRHVARNRPAT